MSSTAEAAEIVVMAVMAVKFGLRQLSMRALKFYKSALEFSMSAARLNMRFCKSYMRAPKFYMRAPKFHMRTAIFYKLYKLYYKPVPYLYLRTKKLFEGEEKNYIRGEILLYIFLFSLYWLLISLYVCGIIFCANGPP